MSDLLIKWTLLIKHSFFYLTRYPDELAWQINVTKKFIRKSSCMDKFHNFLVQETETVTYVLKKIENFCYFMWIWLL